MRLPWGVCFWGGETDRFRLSWPLMMLKNPSAVGRYGASLDKISSKVGSITQANYHEVEPSTSLKTIDFKPLSPPLGL